MIRRVSFVALALCLNTVVVSAQSPGAPTTQLTVNAAAADVYKSPTVASAVIGKAQRGMVLEITRNLGSWVEVPWTTGEGGVAYMHVNAGSIAARTTLANSSRGASPTGPSSSAGYPTSSMPDNPAALSERILAAGQPSPSRSDDILLHTFGMGARMNAATLGFGAGFGATARTWWRNRMGLQFDVLHSRLPSLLGTGHVTSLQFAPSVMYALPSAISSSVWVRPYLGGGGSLYRTTFNRVPTDVASAGSENSFGVQTFGGAETTFAGAPQFAVSAELGYRWWQASTVGVTPERIGVSLTAHWYIK